MKYINKTLSIAVFSLIILIQPGLCRAHSLGFLESLLLGENHLYIGITLHPYYSYVKNIVGDTAKVVPITGAGYDFHGKYTPTSNDIDQIKSLDILVLNSLGHDNFAYTLLNAGDITPQDIIVVRPNSTIPTISMQGSGLKENTANPHTYISIDLSIQQIHNISNKLRMLYPVDGKVYSQNAKKYTAKLKAIKREYMISLSKIKLDDFQCATTHAGFDYLFTEFGLKKPFVLETMHGITPTQKDVNIIAKHIRDKGITVIFSIKHKRENYVKAICEKTGAKEYFLSSMTNGEYTADKFENDLRFNLESLTRAIIDAAAVQAPFGSADPEYIFEEGLCPDDGHLKIDWALRSHQR